ncbi:MAG: O-antigen ligase family protein [Acidobacteriaceae bacterium]
MFTRSASRSPWSVAGETIAKASSVPMLLPGTIGFYFSFRVAIVLVTVRLFLLDAQTGVAAGLVCNYLLVVVVGFFSLGPASSRLRSMVRGPMWWVLAFLAFSGVSLLWSSTASLAAAAAFWCAMAADVAIVMPLLRNGSADETGQALMQGFIWGTCAFAAIAWLLPVQSDLRLGDEELLGPNQIGYSCAFAFFLAQYLMSRRSRLWGFPAAFLAITLLRSLSKTTIVAFFAAEAFILLRDRTMTRARKLMLIGLALVILFAFQGLIASYYTIYTNAGSQAETLTGRLGIWAYFVTEAVQQPWIGHGFHSVWKVVPPFGPFEARHAHNELLQQFYAYGAAGIILMAGLYGSVFLQIRRLPRGPVKTFFQGLLIFILVRGLADTEPFDLSLPLWFVCLITPLLMEWTVPLPEEPLP